ncbi:hypothetical protein E2C01_053245 [Portunus trituberculatus]|uniref:Uncharacterized protein n=1 Tax=Portunus trituberculatus TaxID=210409 RepID=A0A5B7GNN1_PORTR|nr:hypothetical protein [Portunus trituberculatus]
MYVIFRRRRTATMQEQSKNHQPRRLSGKLLQHLRTNMDHSGEAEEERRTSFRVNLSQQQCKSSSTGTRDKNPAVAYSESPHSSHRGLRISPSPSRNHRGKLESSKDENEVPTVWECSGFPTGSGNLHKAHELAHSTGQTCTIESSRTGHVQRDTTKIPNLDAPQANTRSPTGLRSTEVPSLHRRGNKAGGDHRTRISTGRFGTGKLGDVLHTSLQPRTATLLQLPKIRTPQSNCTLETRCGVCSGKHQTEQCIIKHKEGQMTSKHCPNCGESHLAWSKSCAARRALVSAQKSNQIQFMVNHRPALAATSTWGNRKQEPTTNEPDTELLTDQDFPCLGQGTERPKPQHEPRRRLESSAQRQQNTEEHITLTKTELKDLFTSFAGALASMMGHEIQEDKLSQLADNIIEKKLKKTPKTAKSSPAPAPEQPTQKPPAGTTPARRRRPWGSQ